MTTLSLRNRAFRFRTYRLWAMAALLLVQSLAALAGNFYVSPAGSDTTGKRDDISKPFKTPAKVATLVAPGDTVWLMNGTYAPFTLSISGLSERARITWKALPGHLPEIKNDGQAWNTIDVHASYQTIDGLILTGNNDRVTLADAEADLNRPLTPSGAKISPQSYWGDPKFNTNGVVIENNKPSNKFKAHHLTVQNSTLRKFGCGGIVALSADYIVIRNNKIYDNAWYARYGCSGATIFPMNADPSDTFKGYRQIVTGNMLWNNRGLVKWIDKHGGPDYSDGNGFILDTAAKDASGQIYQARTLIANNLFVNNGGSGAHTLENFNADVVNNTAYMNGSQVGYADFFAYDTRDARFFNNVVYARRGAPVNGNTNGTRVVFNRNVYFDGSDQPNIATSVRGDSNGQTTRGADDLIGDPQFVNPQLTPCTDNPDKLTLTCTADFRLKAESPAVGSGIWIESVTPSTDMTGAARGLNAISRGAYEPMRPAAPKAAR